MMTGKMKRRIDEAFADGAAAGAAAGAVVWAGAAGCGFKSATFDTAWADSDKGGNSNRTEPFGRFLLT